MSVTLRDRVLKLVESPRFQGFIVGVILVNAVILGIETYQDLPQTLVTVLDVVNTIAVTIFVIEIVLRIYAHRGKFFRDPWGWFDLIIVAIALIPAAAGGEVFRVLRALRILRLLSTVKSMRLVVGALVAAMPGILSIGALLTMVIYIFAVVTTTLYSHSPYFADLGMSTVTLFRLMMGDGWPDAVIPVADGPGTWVLFISFTIVSALIVLNLFIAVIVEAMDRVKRTDVPADDATGPESEILTEIRALRDQVDRLEARLERPAP